MALAAAFDSDPHDGLARMEKRPGAFRTISEVADELGVPQHVLRFWESRFSQIRPMKRAGGRRYYRPDDVDLLKGVQRLLHGQGYTIKGAQRVLRENGLRFVQSIGRGEAEARTPDPEDSEVAGHPTAMADAAEAGSIEAAGAEDRLVALLSVLVECRAALAGLKSDLPPEP